jgi:hypothetical protein
MTHQEFLGKRKAELAAALIASAKPVRTAPTTAKGVAASLGFDHDDDVVETVPNPNNGQRWFRVTATNIVPAHLAGGNE